MDPQHLHPISGNSAMSADSLTDHLLTVHRVVSSRYPDIDRVALATYDPVTDLLRTFASSNHDGIPLEHYEARLSSVPSLAALAQTHQSRVVDDIAANFQGPSSHTDWLKARDYQSSFTVPIYHGDALAAFLFFDSKRPGAFSPDTAAFLEVFANLISQMYLMQLQVLHSMVGSVHLVSGLARIRDLETGQHLDRMGAYSLLMARGLAERLHLSDEFIEYVYLFAPLHDIGKVGIPDSVLLKPGKLTEEEWVIMRRHVEIGETIINQMGQGITMGSTLATQVMHNIVTGHHERGDGSGYPRGLTMDQIPLEARIVAVADVYDALSNRRPYKKPWTEEAIVTELRREADLGRLDHDCVEALLAAKAERRAILSRFMELEALA